jgi:NADP-dependent 3-hydroxy acid dehydrogenase YdfG/Flp pilus assembly protein TadD
LNEDDDKADKLIEKLSSKTEKDDDKLEITEEMLRKDPELSAIYDNNKPAVNGSHFMEELEEPKVEEHKVALEVSSIFEEATASDNTLSLENEITEGVKVTEVANKPQAELHLDNTARYNHAAQLAEQQKYAEALEQLEIIIENDRTNIDAYMLMAYVAEQSGDFLLAQNCLEKVTLLKPNYNGIFYKLGILTNQHFKNQKRKAIHYFKDALRQDPHFADAYYQLALLEIEQHGNFDDAINHLQKAIECEPHHANATFELAKAYYEIGNRKEANLFYLKAAELKPALATPINDEIFSYEEPQPEPPQLNDNGMIALVTGATSGIGRATAEILAKHGYRLILTGRRNERLSEIKESFENEFHNKIHLLNFDVRDLNSVKDAIESLDEEWKNVDILINNAGLASGLAPIHEGDIQDWELMIDTNIKGLLYMTRVIAPQMVERRKGHIVNVCSIAGKEIYPSGNVYIATKHAVDALTRAMRVDLYKHNIRVSQVAPGMVEETEFALVRFHGDAEKAKIYEDIKPLKASDVADAIYFIISRPDYVNIQDILMMSTQQGGANFYDRSGRDDR